MTIKEKERLKTIQDIIAGDLVASQAATKLSLGIRQVQRIKKRVKDQGVEGIIHANRGKPSNRCIDKKLKVKALKHIKESYMDFGPTLATEKLQEINKITLSVSCVRGLMTDEGLWKPKPRRVAKKYRCWRPRKDNEGEMQQFDGSYHLWLEGRLLDEYGDPQELCLLASIDDATGKITGLELAAHEGVVPVMGFWESYIKENGKPVSIYLDKYSTYKINHKSAKDNNKLLTQFQRAMKQLDIRTIVAHSPEAKGRVERLFQTLQDRLVKELRLAGICTVEEANVYIRDKFIPAFNEKFSVIPKNDKDLHRVLDKEEAKRLPSILSIHSTRKVNNDYTIRFNNMWLQLNERQPTTVYKKDAVLVEERLDGTIWIELKGKYLDYTMLPERPAKIHKIRDIPLSALTPRKAPYKPPLNHPWRQQAHAAKLQKQLEKVLV